VQAEEHVNVTIPKGVMTGTRLRLKGMGDYGKDRRGDLYIDIHEQRDRRFIRDGDNIRTDLHVPLHIALLGGAVVVPTIDGEKRIEISEGTQNNSKVTIGGAGIPHFNGSGEGDEILNVIVDIPRHLTGEQKDLIKKAMEPEDGKKKFGLF
jgi:DnaJ-class molecular chaperone